MPPKVLYRPAARGKAAPRPKGAARARGIRRPAALEGKEKGFEDFGEVRIGSIPPGDLLTCGKIFFTEVIYWKEATSAVGTIEPLKREEGELWATVKIDGTKSEHLLRYLSGVPERTVQGHLCSVECGQELTSDNVVHLVKGKKLEEGDKADWMTNLLAAGRVDEDELAGIRQEAEDLRSPSPGQGEGAKKSKSKKAEKKEKKKEEGRKQKRSRTPPGNARGGRDLGVILGNSGLDPSPQKRKRFLKKAKHMVKKGKKKKHSSSSAGSSGKSSSSSPESSIAAGDIFGQSRMAKRIWRRCPGVLTASALATMQEQLLTAQGQLWDLDRQELPPLFLQFFRGNMGPRMPPAMRREGLHLAFCLHLGIQGRIPEMLDVLSQRLKALDGQTNGKHWTVTSQYELVPEENAAVATAQETEAAAKEAREAGRLRAQVSRPYGSTAYPERTQDWKKEGEKGKGAKGAGKGKDWRQSNRDQKDFRRDREADREKDRPKGK